MIISICARLCVCGACYKRGRAWTEQYLYTCTHDIHQCSSSSHVYENSIPTILCCSSQRCRTCTVWRSGDGDNDDNGAGSGSSSAHSHIKIISTSTCMYHVYICIIVYIWDHYVHIQTFALGLPSGATVCVCVFGWLASRLLVKPPSLSVCGVRYSILADSSCLCSISFSHQPRQLASSLFFVPLPSSDSVCKHRAIPITIPKSNEMY